ncbi:hypothetical protein [Rubrobacter indicoceani]|uniref:hypothetical protein n=1 Tax=Rubrobacter indicoceani TaxID=2051957 RepID=UPI0013C41E32|nr:hypothetical protein [Rubrobacter indicoceani]
MEPHIQESAERQVALRRMAGRMLGITGLVCAVLAVLAVLSATGLGLMEGMVGVLFGVAGYMLGSRFFGNAAVVSCLVALFIVLVLGQNLS